MLTTTAQLASVLVLLLVSILWRDAEHNPGMLFALVFAGSVLAEYRAIRAQKRWWGVPACS
jgi:hypothetical protein